MTIIHPNKNKNYWNPLFLVLGGGILVGVILIILFYSLMTGFKYEVERLEARIEELRLSNAELRSELSTLTSLDHLQKIAADEGLIRDKNPQWVFASR